MLGLASAAAVLACGARSDPGGLDGLRSLGTVDAGTDPIVVAVDDSTSARRNPRQPRPDAPATQPPANADPSVPTPIVPTDPGVNPTDPVTPVPMTNPDVPSLDPDPSDPPTQPTDPVAPVPEPTPDVPSSDAPDPDAPRLWLYLDAAGGSLTNVYDDRERFLLPSVDPQDEMLKPWSPEGRYLTSFEGNRLRFHDLMTGE
jgi:hypothetical protein